MSTAPDLSAAALLRRFAVHGRYYAHEHAGRRYELRSHLEIFDHALPWPEARSRQADLVAVMMNPGGSRPLAEPDADGWAPAMPDRTQYQLMKLALLNTAWPVRHIRVINLSDLRTPKSAELFATLPQVGEWHSLFSPGRSDALARALGAPDTPVLLAWGLSPALRGLATQALAATRGHPLLGLTDDGLAYRHPLPQRADLQRQWLDSVLEQCKRIC
ncbi:MAG: DUF1643 domain-containing protein [Pseudomonadota bacterium]|nr:DUF1643 domain-containing protein [Pseudomonadota bacterium]